MLRSNTSALSAATLAALLLLSSQAAASETTVISEATYLMADGDTLAHAEETVLQRAKQRAIEEAGVYLESSFLDIEKTADGRNIQASSLEIHTIAAAITKTEVLESRRAFENDRPSFYMRIRAVVDLDHLQEAIRRWHADQQFAEHFRRLQKENSRLKAEIRELKTTPTGVRTLTITPPNQDKHRGQAQELVERAIVTPDLQQKLNLTSQAIILAPQAAEPLVVRGQTYLQLVSAAYSKKSKPSDYSRHIDHARMDFDRALLIDPQNTWALLGQGDVHTWRKREQDAARSYEQALALNPFFDTARHRLITLYTTQARKLATRKRWSEALQSLDKLLSTPLPDSWILDHKETYLLRSDLYTKLGHPTRAIDDLSVVLRGDPTDARTLLARGKLYQNQLQGHMAKNDFERACLLGSAEACQQLP
jgi:tetratricopeptide (TPR) repeat protein